MQFSRSRRWSAFICILLTMVYSVSLPAQSGQAVAVTGVVSDSSGAIVPDAVVRVTQLSTEAMHVVRTGGDGSFILLALSAGRYRVSIGAPGFATQQLDIELKGAAFRLPVVLTPEGAHALVEVDASDSDPAGPAQAHITSQEIDRIPTVSVSSPFSSLVTVTTPGVAADSNGSFHPLGDHAEASFVVDGQPITDQQSRTFSTQVSLNALQSVDVREGTPGADVGDKTSMVIVAQTRSGLDQRTPHGAVVLSRGGYATTSASARLAAGTGRFGSFTAVDGLNSARFLDAPEAVALHGQGDAANLFERLDWKADTQTSLQLNASASRSWFQSPNTLDQQNLGQDQRQTVGSFNIAPQLLHTFNKHVFAQSNLWVRQDKVRYRPSEDAFSDTPATLEQARRLTSAGIRTEFTVSQGRHNAVGGMELKHTLLAEQFSTGITDAAYNSPCLNADGTPSSDTALTDIAQCGAAGLTPNSSYLQGLAAIDLTRGGTLYSFRGTADIRQEAMFAQDFVRLGPWIAELGMRFDWYDGLARKSGAQPRVGMVYNAAALHTSFHVNYARVFLTPYNENLIVASSSGPGSVSSSLGAADSEVLTTGHRNQFNAGASTTLRNVSFSGEYLWKFTYGAYDFDVLLNSPLTFPTQFRKSKIDGALLRATLAPWRGIAAYATVSHVRSRLFGPELGGISFSAPYGTVARPDHDEGLAMNANLRYQWKRRGPRMSASYRYDGGLVAVAVPTMTTALALTGDEQQQMGLHCDAAFATQNSPIRACTGVLGATRIRIPRAGTENDDTNPPRIAVRNTVDLAAGEENLLAREGHALGVRVEVTNLGNVNALYNFLSTFSGTHFLAGRTLTAGVHYSF